jgi:hypothetical protein
VGEEGGGAAVRRGGSSGLVSMADGAWRHGVGRGRSVAARWAVGVAGLGGVMGRGRGATERRTQRRDEKTSGEE